MSRAPVVLRSVITRLVLSVLIGGAAMLVGLATINLRTAEQGVVGDLTYRVNLTVQSLRQSLAALHGQADRSSVEAVVAGLTSDPSITAVRVHPAGGEPIVRGPWPMGELARWTVMPFALPRGDEVSIRLPTHVQSEFALEDEPWAVELVVDGPSAALREREAAVRQLLVECLLLTVMTLLGLLMLRRWFSEPLSSIARAVAGGGEAPVFHRLAARQTGEFADLCRSIAGLLTHIEATTEQLRRRESAFASLYQQAPAAMVSLEVTGTIVKANRRAGVLLGVTDETQLLGVDVSRFIDPVDLPRLRQMVEQLEQQDVMACELRLRCDPAEHAWLDASVQASAVRDDAGRVTRVRLAMTDITTHKAMQRRLSEQSRLLNLVLDHMSEGILLIDAAGHVAAHNAKLAIMLGVGRNALVGRAYVPATFWSTLGLRDEAMFIERMSRLQADATARAQERFVAEIGSLLFQAEPVLDEAHRVIGRLWVIADVTALERSEKLMQEQSRRLSALRRMGEQLSGVDDERELLPRIAELLYGVLGAEAVGLQLRRQTTGERHGPRMLHRGRGPMLREANRNWLESVECELMPTVMDQPSLACWEDLPAAKWARSAAAAGLSAVAAVPLRNGGTPKGLLWIARQGGQHFDPTQLLLLEALAPVIADRIEIASLRRRLTELDLTDAQTRLPTRLWLGREIDRRSRVPGGWAIMVVRAPDETCLLELATSFQRLTRGNSVVARLEGAHLAVLIPEGTLATASQLVHRVARPAMPLAIGLACVPEDDADVALALAQRRADLATKSRSGKVFQVVSEGGYPLQIAG